MSKPTTRQIAQTIVKILDKPSPARSVAAYLVQERRTRDLAPIMREVMKLRGQQQGIIEASAVSAYPLTAETEKAINELLIAGSSTAKQVVLNKIEDPEAVGGVRVTTGDMHLDLTIHGRLNRLKQTSLERN